NISSPVTFIRHLGDEISSDIDGLLIQIYSHYPWSQKKEPVNIYSDFKEKSLAFFKENPEKIEFYQIEKIKDHAIFEYARAVSMKSSCIACHNTDIHSPKKDWNEGEIGGIIAVIRSLDTLTPFTWTGIQQTIFTIIGLSALILSALALVFGRFKHINKELEKRVQERTAKLTEANQDLAQRNTLIRQVFGRYLSDGIVANLLESSHSLNIGGQRRKITILTSDLRGFTAISEHLSAEEVIS
ncbi:MAG: DUF3365 domain-containing protein, partial [Microcystaceae cyanobacterium]